MADLDSILSGKGAVASDAGKVEEPKVAEQAQADPGNEGAATTQEGEGGQKMVPHEALHAEKQKVKRYTEQVAEFERKQAERDAAWERRLEQILGAVKPAQQQEQPKAPDFWEDPNAFVRAPVTALQEQLQQQIQEVREHFSKSSAIREHGADVVKAAEEAVNAALSQLPPEHQAQMRAARAKDLDPYSEMVTWHKKRQAAAEVGDDPAAYRERLKAEILAEMQGNPPANTPAAQSTAMPSNLAGARNVGSRSGPAWSGPQSLNDIFKR